MHLQVWQKEDDESESGLEANTEQSERPEETLHRNEGDIGHQVEREEGTG